MKRANWSVLAAFLCFGLFMPSARAHAAGLRIVGALSNFDCREDDPDDAEGFEIEIEGIHKEDVTGTWTNSVFGAPTVTTGGTANAPTALIRYYSNTRVVHSGDVTHFGVTLSTFSNAGTVSRRWLIKPTTVRPNPLPAPVSLPSHSSEVVSTSGVSAIRDSLHNDSPDGGDVFWIVPYINTIKRKVKLDELMTDNTVVSTSIALGDGPDGKTPVRMDPNDTWKNDDAVGSDDIESGVLSYDVYADVITYDASGADIHTAGALIATVMDATVTGTTAVVPASMTLSDSSVYGPATVSGTVRLNGAAPAGGVLIKLTSNSASASVPATITVPANATSAPFTISVKSVSSQTNVNITATAPGGLKTAGFVINLASLNSVWLSYLNARGGMSFTGAVYLMGTTASAGLTVALTSSSPYLQVPASVKVGSGKSTVAFNVTSKPVTSTIYVTVTATAGGITKSTVVRLIH